MGMLLIYPCSLRNELLIVHLQQSIRAGIKRHWRIVDYWEAIIPEARQKRVIVRRVDVEPAEVERRIVLSGIWRYYLILIVGLTTTAASIRRQCQMRLL